MMTTKTTKKTGPRPHVWVFGENDKIKFSGENYRPESSKIYQVIEVLKKSATVGAFKEKAEKAVGDKYLAQKVLRDAVKEGQLKVVAGPKPEKKAATKKAKPVKKAATKKAKPVKKAAKKKAAPKKAAPKKAAKKKAAPSHEAHVVHEAVAA